MNPTKILYTAHAISTGGRNGHTQTDDGQVSQKLATPKEMGGQGGGSNPEQLFAAGYAACFGSAIEFVARRSKTRIGDVMVKADVGIGPADTGFALAVTLTATLLGLNQATAEKLVAEAHEVCPYSNATRGNIDVAVHVKT